MKIQISFKIDYKFQIADDLPPSRISDDDDDDEIPTGMLNQHKDLEGEFNSMDDMVSQL